MAYNPLYLIFFILALLYVVLTIFSVLRAVRLHRISKGYTHPKMFYLAVIAVCVFRTFAFFFIFLEDVNNLSSLFLLLSLPDAVLTVAFLLLFSQLVVVIRQAHMDELVERRLLRTEGKRTKSKLQPAIIGLLVLWVLLQVAFYGSYIVKAISSGTISDEIGIANLFFPTLVLVTIVVLHFRYASYPIKSPAWQSKVAKVRFATLVWSLGRYVRGVLSLISAVADYALSREVVDANADVSFSVIAVLIVYLICCEVICILLVLDYSFVMIFAFAEETVESDVETRTQQSASDHSINGGESRRFSVVADSSLVLAQDVKIEREFRARKHGLGKLFLGKLYGHDVIIRKITFPRVSGYVIEEFEEEIESLKSVFLTDLLPVHAANVSIPDVQIIMPFLATGSLYDFLHVQRRSLTLSQQLKVCLRIAQCMSEIHKLGRKHGHLTSHNVLLDEDLTPYITDLGLQKLKKYAGLLINYTNKSAWSSPELLAESCTTALRVTESDDMYSYGVVVWEIFTGQEPFPGLPRSKLLQLVSKEALRPEIPSSIDDRLSELIKSCWNIDPARRPSFSQLLFPLESLTVALTS